MKKIFRLMLLCATMVGFASCEKDDGEIYYAGKQKEIVDFFSGRTFVSTFAIGDWYSTTTIKFSNAYNPPIKGTLEKGNELWIYGQYNITYSGSNTTPSTYTKYYWIPLEGDQLCSFVKTQNINSSEIRDIEIIDKNTFRMKLPDTYSWDTYTAK